MVITRTVEMHTQLVGYDFKKNGLPTDKNIAVENSKVSNDSFWKTNKYTDQDVFGRTLDLTALINKPDGYLKGSLSDTEDVDYYEFNITEYRALSFAKDTYNRDITITLDHIPEGCDYEMVLYDEEGLTDTEEMRAIKEIRQKYRAYYTEQMEKLHQEQAEAVMQGGAVPDDEQIHNLLEKKAADGTIQIK